MSLSMYTASVPVFVRTLTSLGKWLAKAQAHAEARKFDPSVFITARLAPDMLAFPRQIQIACDTVKFGVARLAGVESPVFEDNETTMEELRARIDKTLAYVNSFTPAQIDGSDDRQVSVPGRNGATEMRGEDYLKHFVLPNLYFHATTAYALLRHNGVELGKGDFLGLK
ncbi:MAG: hypothetical protein RLZZ618_526 [Pseudomonadota bacterium]|jgi:hypothetical protein